MKHGCLHILGNHRGISGLWAVIGLGVLTGVATLVVDGGFLVVTKNELQTNADLAALAAGMELNGDSTDEAAVKAKAVEYSRKQVFLEAAGQVLSADDVIIGNWNTGTRTFSPGGSPTNSVQVTTGRTQATGNPVDYFFAPLMGYQYGDVQATAVAYRATPGLGGRFLCDDEMFDKDILSIEDLAAANGDDPEDYVTDNDGDWFVDIPPGSTIEVPTGQTGDTGLFDIAHFNWPFTSGSSPSFTDFLNYNENGGPRENAAVKALLDPLEGVSPVDDPGVYDSFVNPDFVQVCPLFKSDVTDLENNEVNALGERRGLLAFKIKAVGDDPSGSKLPNLTIEIVDPSTINIEDVQPPSKIHLVL